MADANPQNPTVNIVNLPVNGRRWSRHVRLRTTFVSADISFRDSHATQMIGGVTHPQIAEVFTRTRDGVYKVKAKARN